MAKETAEKKLLKLIESTQAQESAVAAQPSAAAPAAGAELSDVQQVANSVKGVGISLPKLSLPPFLGSILNVFRGFSPTAAGSGAFGLREVNRILSLGIVVVAGLLCLSFLSGYNEARKSMDFAVEQVPANTDEFSTHFQDLADYLGALMRRNIFQPYEVKVVQQEEGAVEEPVLTPMNERIKDLKLVGISWLDSPESASAMIENTQSGVTYFLKSGEQINSLTVKQIFADSIIIRLGDEEMEMRL